MASAIKSKCVDKENEVLLNLVTVDCFILCAKRETWTKVKEEWNQIGIG